jgi:hypothetical protein
VPPEHKVGGSNPSGRATPHWSDPETVAGVNRIDLSSVRQAISPQIQTQLWTTFTRTLRALLPNDSPLNGLSPTFGEIARSFAATMYAMRTPDTVNGCTAGSACSIPVPLGSASWNFYVDAINTLGLPSPTTYILQNQDEIPSPAPLVPIVPGYSYPIWTTTILKNAPNHPGTPLACQTNPY